MSLGTVRSLWRYPVKSMAGEELDRCVIGPKGMAGDRAWAVVDAANGGVASAKNPRVWPGLIDCRARLGDGAPEIRLPDGTPAGAEQLSAFFGRRVELASSGGGEIEME